ncbi:MULTISPECIES: adenylyl-sulfate kinase [unclassified Pseudomonas]|uniref:adenylyl-sulfate kinase n=1 Tax=unclassified Pseudomonas TaxID=196821 RepID=UPI00215E622C|nr:adenylyl-sulfate kinase [Pseudomonas sp. B21-015]UVM49101.1 adenylyl-sulfate kinase [Pseudomonas sp. B21-015]
MHDRKAIDCGTHSPLNTSPFGPSSAVFWLTGVSGAGKTTIATSFESVCRTANWPVVTLDGDVVRSRLNSDLGFSEQDRAENIRRIAEVAALMADAHLLVIVSCISPMKSFRDMARTIIGDRRFIEVHIDTPLEVAEERDPKGLYQRARAGKIQLFTGIHAQYEAPLNPQVRIDTTTTDIDTATDILRRYYIDSVLRPTPHEPSAFRSSPQTSLDTATSE